jgi:glycosyltransferase involved in cell wall biosynthesis
MKVTAIVNMHREGRLVNSALRSLQRNLTTLADHAVPFEAILILDSPDDSTREVAHEFCPTGGRVMEVALRDLGGARNMAIDAAAGEFIAFLDADDIWGDEWLLRALQAAEREEQPTVWHPEASLYFGNEEPYWFLHRDDDILGWDWQTLALRNHWTALCFTSRALLRELPYKPVQVDRGQGYEDWSFNMDVVAASHRHRVVPGTLHLIRKRPYSLVRVSAERNILVSPSDLFILRVGAGAAVHLENASGAEEFLSEVEGKGWRNPPEPACDAWDDPSSTSK